MSNSAIKAQNGYIIYSGVSKSNATQDIVGFGQKQPDTIFYSIYFENFFSVKVFTLGRKNIDTKLDTLDVPQYTLNFVKEGYRVEKDLFCRTKYKIPFFTRELHDSKEIRYIKGYRCQSKFWVGAFNDTTKFFITSQLPSSAGYFILANIPECILAVETDLFTVVPSQIKTDAHLDFSKLKKPDPALQSIVSPNRLWIETPVTEILKGEMFPPFYGTTIKNEKLTNEGLIKNNTSNSIVLVLDHIRNCKEPEKYAAHIYQNQEKQSFELIDALNEVAGKLSSKFLVIAHDYQENIKDLNYPNLYIVPNAEPWADRLKIFAYPVIAILNEKGVVKNYVSLFELDNSEGYVKGFMKLLTSN